MGGPVLVFWSDRTQNIAIALFCFEKRYRKREVEKREKSQRRRLVICILLREGSKDMLCSRSHLDSIFSSRLSFELLVFGKEVLVMKNGVKAKEGVFMCVVACSEKLRHGK